MKIYMKKIINVIKKTKWIIAVILVLALICTIALVMKKEKSDEKPDKSFEITMVYSDGNSYAIYDSKSEAYQSINIGENEKENGQIQVKKTDDSITCALIYVEKDGKVIKTIELDKDNVYKDISLKEYEEGDYNISFMLEKNKNQTFYVSTGNMFIETIYSDDIENNELILLNDLDISVGDEDKIYIKKPFTLITKGKMLKTDKVICFVSEEAGEMYIKNENKDDIQADVCLGYTPLWEYTVDCEFDSFMESRYCLMEAKSINGRSVETGHLYVDSQEKLLHIIEEGKIGRLKDNTSQITLSGDLDISSVIIDKPIKLEICGNVSISEKIKFIGAWEGNIEINTEDSEVSLYESIEFETPNADIIWNDENAPSTEYMEKYMNMKSYNGVVFSEYIGGMGTCMITGGNIGGVDFKVEGNYIDLTLGYANNINILKSTPNVILSEDGQSSIVEDNGNYYCVTTDKNNNLRGYKININYKEYKIPVIYITTDSGQAITSKEEYVGGKITVDYNMQEDIYSEVVDKTIKIRGRGHSSWELEKKPYKIKFEKKTSLFGLTEAKEWVILANHIDRSLMRNKLAMSMASLLDNMIFVPHVYMVDVFVNGEYQGVYSISEQIEIKDGRISGERDSAETDTDYLLEWGGEKEATSFGNNVFATELNGYIEIKEPDAEILTQDQYNYIKGYIEKIDETVKNKSGYEEYLDIESLIDWFILNEFSYNVDGTFRRSDFFIKQKDGRLCVAAPWDYDYAFGNFSLDSDNYAEWICLGNERTDAYEGKYINTNWMTYLLTDENFKQKLKVRWNEVGEDLYKLAMDTINETEDICRLSAEDNFTVWNRCLGVKLQYESWRVLQLGTYGEQIEYLRSFIEKRYRWMDNEIKGM